MRGNSVLAPAPGETRFTARLAAALDPQRVAIVALVTILLSLGALLSHSMQDFFSPLEIVAAWLEHLVELGLIAVALLAAFTLLDTALPRDLPLRPVALGALLVVVSVVLSVLLHAYYAEGFTHLPPPVRILADALRWGLPAVFLTLIADVYRRGVQADSAAHATELAGTQLEQSESEQRLALLQAQIEPHFLINVLGNVRRLYRMRPEAGAEAIGNLLRYLRTALPQLRTRRTTLGEELESVRAYLDLFRLRMGEQLAFSIEADASLHEAEFPPMLLVTLVENAIKHGLEPARGGSIEVRATRRGARLEVSVVDDGAGFGATAISGTGVGLANVKRQLAARYQERAGLSLEGRKPRGAQATITIPLERVRHPESFAVDDARAPTLGVAATSRFDALPPWRSRSSRQGLLDHRGAWVMAGLLAFAAPVTFFTGALGVMRLPSAGSLVRLGMWWTLFGATLWVLLLSIGHGLERVDRGLGRAVRTGLWPLAAGAAAGLTVVLTSGRTSILIEQGLVRSAWTAHLHAFTVSLAMALLYFAYLHRLRGHEAAAARLAAAQKAQRRFRQSIVQSRLQVMQSRIDPQLLFQLLDDVQSCYERDTGGAERYLDELVAFLRAALPRLRSASSSLLREIELAEALERLRALSSADTFGMTVDVSSDAMHARFPPGVLLPLLDSAPVKGTRRMAATRSSDGNRLIVTLDVQPSKGSIERVRSLLSELHGSAGTLEVERHALTDAVHAIVRVPYELA